MPGDIVRVRARVQDAKPLQARLTGLGAHDTQVVPVGAQYRP
jgi:acyl dehydratase